jgi:hypothetical protein
MARIGISERLWIYWQIENISELVRINMSV